ncbi:hypothetical protein [Dysgonomonas sp.]
MQRQILRFTQDDKEKIFYLDRKIVGTRLNFKKFLNLKGKNKAS